VLPLHYQLHVVYYFLGSSYWKLLGVTAIRGADLSKRSIEGDYKGLLKELSEEVE
jgi:hypothetical protein